MRVLLAEDHETNQYLIKAYLHGAGHSVEVVENGREAIAAAAGGGFDVILMDVQRPEVDGLAATREIRALDGPAAAVPIIALTATALPEDRSSCFEAGMTDYLAKPIDVEALHSALFRARAAGTEAHRQPPRRTVARG
jgi:CheY-like chemotaxis protein